MYPDNFLKEIRIKWEEISKKNKPYPLIKTLLKGNISKLLLLFFGNSLIVILDSLNVIYYYKILDNLNNTIEKGKSSLLPYIILFSLIYILYIIFCRSIEAYAIIFSFRLISQLDTLIYDKLLRISPYNNITEDRLINIFLFDTKNSGKFFTCISPILLIFLQVLFFIYLLFSYFGISFFIIVIILGLFFFKYKNLEIIINKYKTIIKSKKERRINTISQVFETIQIVKLYSWEEYYLNKIRKEREEELIYFKKAQIILFFLDNIKWTITPFLIFISLFLYNSFNENMEISKLLTSLFIFHKLASNFIIFPKYINELNYSLFSLKRLESFLLSKEYSPSQINIKHKKHRNKNKKENKENKENKDNKDDKDIPIEVLDNKNTSNDENSNINIEKEKTKEKEIMIDIDDINFGIIKKHEEFMVINKKQIKDNIINNKKNKKKSDFELELIDDIKTNDKDKKEKLMKQYAKEEEEKKEDIHNKQKTIKTDEIITILKGIKLKIMDGDLIGIIGKTGSGKSCLFNAILNNLDILNGQNKKIFLNGSIAYIPQKPWILDDTIRNNIIINKPYNEDKYNTIIKLCQLKQDFESLKYNDLTIINDKDNNFSDILKIKISIARAIYSDADIYLFDEIFSSFDTLKGKKIFEKVIKDYLKGKTILLISNKEQYLSMMDYIIIMNEGEIKFYGNIKEAKNLKLYKELILDNIIHNYIEHININKKKKKLKSKKLGKEIETDYGDSDKFLLSLKTSKKNFIESKKLKYAYNKLSKIKIFKKVFTHSGGWFIFFGFFIFCILWKISDFISYYIVTNWLIVDNNEKKASFIKYLLFNAISIIFFLIKNYIFFYSLISFNRNIHETLIYRFLRAPINLFHSIINKSHIINHFSKDISNSDKYFWSLNSMLVLLFHIINAIIISLFCFWEIVFIIPILIFLNIFLYNYYKKCEKGLKNLQKDIRISLLSEVKDTFSGIISIRAFGYKNIFQILFHKKLHNYYKVLVYQIGSKSWFALNNDLISFCFLIYIFINILFVKEIINIGLFGILLNYILQLNQYSFNFFINLNKNETMSTSIESCEAYTNIVQEAPLKLKTDAKLIQNHFPKSGKIEFVNYSVRYRPDTRIMLKDINIIIQPGEKIGIIGNKEGDKNVLYLCLFRILEATTGQILIDDIDISLIGLSLLRSIISIIPQNPSFIEGTLRENLDIEGKCDDQYIIDILKILEIDYIVENNGLNFVIKENGKNITDKEKILINIARAIIKKSKIIIIEEPYSNNDNNIELIIKNIILNILKDSTVITITNKIKSLLEYDKILILEQGKLIEQGNPNELINKKEGVFYNLYSQT